MDEIGRFYLRRLSRVLPAYWLVVGPYSLFLVRAGRIGWDTVLWNLSTLYYWFHIPDAFNWYIPAILAFYLLSPLYGALLRRCPGAWKEFLTAAVFPVSYGLYRLAIPLGLTFFVCRLPAFALGMLMGWYLASGQALTRRHVLSWSALALAGCAVIWLCVTKRMYISASYRVAALLIPLCLLLALLVEKLPEAFQRALGLIGRASLEIYLFNVIITREYDLLSPWLGRAGQLSYYAAVWAADLLLGLALHWLLSRITGRSRVKNIPMPEISRR